MTYGEGYTVYIYANTYSLHLFAFTTTVGHFNFWLSLSLSEITLLFDLSPDLDRTLVQRNERLSDRLSQKLKSPSVSWIFSLSLDCVNVPKCLVFVYMCAWCDCHWLFLSV